MKITFGMYLDGTSWSEKDASIGELQLGPSGMLSLLETQFGLTGPTIHPAYRINGYLQRLVASDKEKAWFHKSLIADPWSTARQMLAWRDELIVAGWEGQSSASDSPRIQALAELERINLPLSPGRGDRLRAVLKQLEESDSSKISDVRLQDDKKLLPPVWQQIFNQLKHIGVSVELSSNTLQPKRTSNLAAAQAYLSGESPTEELSDKDESLIMVKAADEWEAAENMARWLVAERDDNQEVAIIYGTDTYILDQALRRHGLPEIGGSKSSRWRAALQVLPLVLANAWKPVDIGRVVELLSLPLAPIPNYASYHLFRALRKEPGVGGPAWKTALVDIEIEFKKRAEEKGKKDGEKKAHQLVANINNFLVTDRYLPDTGIPDSALIRRCQWVIEWLAWRIGKDPMLKEVVGHAREMQEIVKGRGKIPRVEVERILDTVIGVGSVTPDRFQQAAPWKVYEHPGQITKPIKTVIWWGFTEPLLHMPVYWSESERANLKRSNTIIEESKTYRAREAEAWRRGFLQAEERFLMFNPGHINGEPAYEHPFWDEISSAVAVIHPEATDEDILSFIARKSKNLYDGDHWQLAGRSCDPPKVLKVPPRPHTDTFAISREMFLKPKSLSYTQMNTMIGCPMSWILQYQAKLRVSDTLSLPTGNTMIGTFCHRIVQELYSDPDNRWTPKDAKAKALQLYDSMVGFMASELLLEGNKLDNDRYRLAIGDAVEQLVMTIERLDLSVEKSEAKIEGDFEGIPFIGFADLLLRDKEGHLFVLDLKWSSSANYHKDQIEEGSALQLASYAWITRPAEGARWTDSGYFMLAQGKLLSDSRLLGVDALVPKRLLEQVWKLGVNHWNSRVQAINSGVLEASGVTEQLLSMELNITGKKASSMVKSDNDDQGLLYQRPPCKFCDFSALCGLAVDA